MKCLTARKFFYLREAAIRIEDLIQARQHINACIPCRSVIQQDEQLKQVLQQKLNAGPVPPAYRASVLATISAELARQSSPAEYSWRRFGVPLTAAAAIVVLILSTVFITRLLVPNAGDNQNSFSALAQDHLTSNLRVHPLDIQTADASELETWFTGRLDFSVRIPQLPQLELFGGRLCAFNGDRIVYLMYRKESHPISMYILEQGAINLADMQPLYTTDLKQYYHGFAKGYNIILWSDKGLVYGLVSDMNEHDLIALATQTQTKTTTQ